LAPFGTHTLQATGFMHVGVPPSVSEVPASPQSVEVFRWQVLGWHVPFVLA
jgi:hypothetical protein